MSIPARTRFWLLSTFTIGFAASLWAQAPPSLYDRYTQPIEIFKRGLGTFVRPISSANPEAQAFFNQGFQMMWSFAKPEAVRSFREAWKRDPECAICYWGEAWAWGSYLNAPMSDEEAPHAYAAVQKAKALAAAHASPLERELIDALSVRYVEHFDPNTRVEQDRAYAEAMRKISDAHADDLDLATLYADALFLLEPRRGSRDVNDPNVQRLHHVLEGILAKDLRHPGACHLYVHATESTTVPARAERCAEFLGNSIPGASHINHMPSHTWNEVGRWGDSVRANLDAWHSDLKAAVGEGFAIYPEHNLHMLLYAASMDGQGAIAMRAAKDYAKLTGDSSFQVLTLVRFGRFDEVLDVSTRPKGEIQGALWDFARGYAHLRQGEVDFAQVFLDRVRRTAETSTAMVRVHTAKNLLGIVGGILKGEILRTRGDLPGAIAALQSAVTLQNGLTYDEPEPLPFHAAHWLGAALLEAQRFEEAERAYRDELVDHPHNGWSLLGLQQALAAQKKNTTDVDEDLRTSWSRSDTWIRASRF
ncbi:MAG: tetratricopeptide repeat protein [Vicinamibacterales bacterium]